MKLADYLGMELARRCDVDARIRVIDGDLADSNGAMHVAESKADRFIMGGIAEQNMVSMAAGMAECGLLPWVFSFSAFLCYRAYDQIRVSICQTGLPVVLVGSHAGGCLGRNGKTHQSLNDVCVMASLPNIDIWAPVSAAEIPYMVSEIAEQNRAAYIRLPREAEGGLAFSPGTVVWLTEPSDCVLLSYGYSTEIAMETHGLLADKGIDVGVLHICRLKPYPVEDIYEAIKYARELFIIEDHYSFGGLASLTRHLLDRVRISRVFAWPDGWTGGSGDTISLLEQAGLDPASICESIEEVL
ncbi:transketolase family protein [Desulfoluna spongiiphila]|uniref:Transketolase n=1 Tax=Desulfoluna spongiiphila TaxID=419481 RepID=A0A1G5HXM9_9BACT|nr:transketolase C-terminal domain-containing protein [Desulfoluna spongiiphila]SCY68533.1 transketolase [Desulfoluna spongiiphila]